LRSFLESIEGRHIGFFRWIAVGAPIVVLMFGFVLLYFWLMGSRTIVMAAESRALVADEFDRSDEEVRPPDRSRRLRGHRQRPQPLGHDAVLIGPLIFRVDGKRGILLDTTARACYPPESPMQHDQPLPRGAAPVPVRRFVPAAALCRNWEKGGRCDAYDLAVCVPLVC
jgi:hypothetical protein